MNIFSRLEELDICPREISAYRVINKIPVRFTKQQQEGRSDYALTYVVNGSFDYYFNESINSSECHFGDNAVKSSECSGFKCSKGELTFLPIGATYNHINPAPAMMYVFYFSLSPEISSEFRPAVPIHIKVSDPKHFEHLFEDGVSRFFSPRQSAFAVKSSLCTIFSALADEEKPSKLSEHELMMLSPALEALKDPGVRGEPVPTVADLARICCMSEYAFRELFKRYAGITPKKFIDIRRIEQVESLLISEDITVTDAALSCGFTDPSYFFKLYKRIRGRTLGESR